MALQSMFSDQIALLLRALRGRAFTNHVVVGLLSFMGNLLSLHAYEEAVTYDQVREVLRKRCVTCHNPDELRGDLDLKDLTGLKAGSSAGEVVIPGEPSRSLLFTTVAHLEDPVMPPNSQQIPAREIDLLRRWIAGGAPELTGQSTGSAMTTATPPTASGIKVSGASAPGLSAVRSLPQATAVTTIDTHPSRDLAAFNGLQQAVLWVPSTGQMLGALDVPEGDVSAVRFSPDGQLLLVAAGTAALSSKVIAFDLTSGQRRWERGDETDTILAMDLTADGTTLAVGGPTKTVRLIDVASGKELRALRKHTDWVLTLRFSPDGLLLASGDRFGGLMVWEPRQGELFGNLKDHTGPVHAIDWDASGESLLSGGDDGLLRTWDLHRGELTSRWDAQVGAILAVASEAGWTAAGGRSGHITIWSQPEKQLAKLERAQQIEALGASADGRYLVVADVVGQVMAVNTADWQIQNLLQLPSDPQALQQLALRLEQATREFASKREAAPATQDVANGAGLASLATSADKASEQPEMTREIENGEQTNPFPSPMLSQSEELAQYKQQIAELEKALMASNQSLASLAAASGQLSEALRQLTESQQKLADQIKSQTDLLHSYQQRWQQ